MHLKEGILLCLMQTMFVVPAFAAGAPADQLSIVKDGQQTEGQKIVSVDKCSVQQASAITDKEVKYIKDDVFLDSDGTQVSPCSINGEVYFSKTGEYENGAKIYEESTNKVLNSKQVESAPASGIEVNVDTGYKITYGNDNYEVKDLYDFQGKVNDKEIESVATVDNTVISSDYEQMAKHIKFTDDMKTMPAEHANDIDEEKLALIKEDYGKAIDALAQANVKENGTATNDFIDTVVANNRMLLNSNKIINQFSYDKKYTKKKTDDENKEQAKQEATDVPAQIDGNVFYFYKVKTAGTQFYYAAQKYMKDYVANPKIPVNEKVAVLENLKNDTDFFDKAKQEYMTEYGSKWDIYSNQSQKLVDDGLALYSKATEKEKSEYSQLMEQVNQEIVDKELTALPDKITKAQYNRLSDIDKFKYSPLMKGHYKDTKTYIKNASEAVLRMTK